MSGANLLLIITITVGLLYLTNILANRTLQHFRNKQWWLFSLKLFSCVSLTLIACFSLLMLLLGSMTYYPRRDFDKVNWTKCVSQRYTMVDDLANKVVGWDSKHILSTLGTPEYGQDSISFRYATGDPPQLFGGADPFEIIIEFKDGKAVNCYIQET